MALLANSRLDGLATRLHGNVSFDEGERAALLSLPHTVRTFEPGQYLLREGDKPVYCSIVLGGFVYRHKLLADGGRQIVSIHMRDDIIDLQNLVLESADHNIQALTTTELALIERDLVLDLISRHPVVGRALWRDALVEASILREWVTNVGRRDARTRTAHVLCEFALRQQAAGLDNDGAFELPMTQEQLGDVLGLTPVHVNRTLRILQEDGLIHRSKRSVVIVDWLRLRIAADFRSGYLHLT